MKTIEVTDEMHEALMELAKEVKTQDNHCTALPLLVQIQTKHQVAAYEGCGENIWISEDNEELTTDDEIKEWICQDIYENDESLSHEDDQKVKDYAKQKVDEMTEDDLEEYLENCKAENWAKVEVENMNKYENAFFTIKGAKEHIRINGHNLNYPRPYVNHAYRNSEFKLICNFLLSLVKEKK